MVENKITKLKILIDKHFENITNITKHILKVDNEATEVKNNMLKLINKIIDTLKIINDEFKQKIEINKKYYESYLINQNINDINNKKYNTKNMISSGISLANTIITGSAIDLYYSLKNDKLIDNNLLDIIRDILEKNIILNNDNDNYNIIFNYINLIIEDLQYKEKTTIELDVHDYWNDTLLNLKKVKVLLVILKSDQILKVSDDILKYIQYLKNNNKEIINKTIFSFTQTQTPIIPLLTTNINNIKKLLNNKYKILNNFQEYIDVNYSTDTDNDLKTFIKKYHDIPQDIDKSIKDIQCYNNRLLISYNDNKERCELKQKFDKLKEYF